MKYDKHERRAINMLSPSAFSIFQAIEFEEKGVIVDAEGLCKALSEDPKFVLFSCLTGNGKREELGHDLGAFATGLRNKVENFTSLLQGVGYKGLFLAIVDDTEPGRFWKWEMSQKAVTTWYRMVIEDSDIPLGWEVKLWSDIEKYRSPTYEGFCTTGHHDLKGTILYHRLYEHIKKFPNRGLKDALLDEVVMRKLIQYKFQGNVLKWMMSNAILIQTETPWAVKDPLFHGPLGKFFSSIIHPFPERRR